MACTHQGHVVGMLDRDQRTAKMCIFDRHVVSVKECSDPAARTIPADRIIPLSPLVPHSSCKTRKSGLWKSIRLKHALVVGTCLSLLAPASSAPLRTMLPAPTWIDPCGLNGAASDAPPPNSALVAAIVRQTRSSLTTAEKLMEELARQTFKMDVERLHNYYKDIDYDWLPTKQLPKNLSEQVKQEHLDTLEFQPTLLSVYESLQKFAVVLEQIIWDEEKRNGDFKAKFEKIANLLRPLLCEVNTAIVENHLSVKDVTREDLPSDFKDLDNTHMNMRNWIVYRDYLNMLEYVLQVFNHFLENADS